MGNQLISFRLRDEEIVLLMQQADSHESASLTAQRLVRRLLGTEEVQPNKLKTFLAQVNEFQEQVNTVKIFIDETINERLDAVDRVVDDAIHQQMQAELLKARGRFDKFEQRLDKYFQILRESGRLPIRKPQQPERRVEPLNPSELAQRLINPKTGHPYSQSAISRQKNRINFPLWSEVRDPQGVAWAYEPNDGLFYPLEQS